jgi:hypothetical protein
VQTILLQTLTTTKEVFILTTWNPCYCVFLGNAWIVWPTWLKGIIFLLTMVTKSAWTGNQDRLQVIPDLALQKHSGFQVTVGALELGLALGADRFARHARSPPEKKKKHQWRKPREAGAGEKKKRWHGGRGLKRRASWWPHTNLCSPKVCTSSRPLVPFLLLPTILYFEHWNWE